MISFCLIGFRHFSKNCFSAVFVQEGITLQKRDGFWYKLFNE